MFVVSHSHVCFEGLNTYPGWHPLTLRLSVVVLPCMKKEGRTDKVFIVHDSLLLYLGKYGLDFNMVAYKEYQSEFSRILHMHVQIRKVHVFVLPYSYSMLVICHYTKTLTSFRHSGPNALNSGII